MIRLLLLVVACDAASTTQSIDLSMAPAFDLAVRDAAPPAEDFGSGPGTVTIHIYNQNDQPNVSFVMFQDGAGAWQALPSQPSGIYTLAVADAGGRYGFAAGDVATAGAPVGFLLQATVADGASLEVRLGAEKAPQAGPMTVDASNIPVGTWAQIQIGPDSFNTILAPSGSVGLTGPAGIFDQLGRVVNNNAGGSFASPIIHRRDFDATVKKPAPAAFDFAGAETLTPEMHTLSISGAPANAVLGASSALVIHSSLRRETEANLFVRNVGFQADASGKGTQALSSLPASSVTAADVQSVTATAAVGAALMQAQSWVNLGVDQSLALPDRFRFTLQAWPLLGWNAIDGTTVYLVDWTAANASGDTLRWQTFVTPAWLGGASPSYSFPSLSGVAGWDARLMPAGAALPIWQGTALGYGTLDHALGYLLAGAYKPKAGDTLRLSRSP
jgi:hypothetical protein